MKFKEINPGMVIHCPKIEEAEILLNHLKEMDFCWRENKDEITGNDSKYEYYYIGENSTIGWAVYDLPRKYDVTEFSDLIEPDPRFKVGDKVRVRRNIGDTEKTVPSSYIAQNYEGTEFTIMTTTKCDEGFLYASEDNPYNWSEDTLEPADDSPINSDTDSLMTAKEVLEWFDEHKDEMGKFFDVTTPYEVIANNSAEEIIEKITAYEAAKKAPKSVEVEVGYWYKVYASDTGTIAEKKMWNCTWNEADLRARKIAYDYTKEHGCECCTEIRYICHAKETNHDTDIYVGNIGGSGEDGA